MNIDVADPSLVPIALQGIKAVATAREPLHPTQRAMISLAQTLLLRTSIDVDALAPLDPEALARAIPPNADRARIVRGMVMVCLARGAVTAADAALVGRYAAALAVDEHVVENLAQLAEGHVALLRFDVNRRAFTGKAVAQTLEEEGWFALMRSAAARVGLLEDTRLSEWSDSLASLPVGTLGRELHDYYVRNGFPLPGRKHALPSFGIVHDLCHVLSGYGVDGPGEIEVVSFTAGLQKTDGITSAFFIALQAHLGVKLVAIAPGNVGALDDPRMLERAIRAFERGTHVKVDLFDHWDYRPLLGKRIDDIRADLGVLP